MNKSIDRFRLITRKTGSQASQSSAVRFVEPGMTNGGFTLAEVLITLGIIGVVAALTLPALTANHRKKEVVSRLQKFESTIQQAILLSINDNGPIEYWDKKAMPKNDDGSYNLEQGVKLTKAFYMQYFDPYIKKLDLKEETTNSCRYGLNLYFADGSTSCLKNGACLDFSFDVNGRKKPNQGGYDVFYYSFCPQVKGEYTFAPYYNYREDTWNDRDSLITKCKSESGACARLIKYDGWEIKDDYPYKL